MNFEKGYSKQTFEENEKLAEEVAKKKESGVNPKLVSINEDYINKKRDELMGDAMDQSGAEDTERTAAKEKLKEETQAQEAQDAQKYEEILGKLKGEGRKEGGEDIGKEIAETYERTKKDMETADAERKKFEGRHPNDWERSTSEKKFEKAVSDFKEVEILNDPSTRNYAEEYAKQYGLEGKKYDLSGMNDFEGNLGKEEIGSTKEAILQEERNLTKQMSDLMQPELTGTKRTSEVQESLNRLAKRKNGLRIVELGGLEQAVANLKKQLEVPAGDRSI